MSNWKNRIIGLEYVDPNGIEFNEGNFKTHPEQQQRMMDGIFGEIGWLEAVIVNKNTMHILDGHMRVQLARDNGEETVPVIFVDVDEEEEAKILATFNPIAIFAKEERSKLADLLAQIKTTNSEMSALVTKIAKKHKLEYDPDGMFNPGDGTSDKDRKEEKKQAEEAERLELVEKWGVKPGQLWLVPSESLPGKFHRMGCFDSADSESVRKLLGSDKASIMVTDPPYGIDFEKKFNPKSKDWNKIENDERKGDELRSWFCGILTTWMPYMKDESAWYVWSAIFEEGFALYHAIKDAGIHIQAQIVWAKNVFSLGQTDYQWQHEICWYGFKKALGKGKKHRWEGGRDQSTLWDIRKVSNASYLHPMQKPTELYARAINNHTSPGDICVDPFLGSGTQIIAAEQLGRLCYGTEIDPIWVAVALERFEQAGMTPELEK